jgi:hypothetical protein
VHSESWVVSSEVHLPDVKNDEAFLKALEPYKRQLLQP